MNQEIKTPRARLVTFTQDPLETVYAVWEASKNTGPLMTTEEVKKNVPREEVEKLFRAVIAQHIPIGEHCDFVFMLENISVSWREQAVRHRIGTLASPERVGSDFVFDAIPNLADSSWWSQSMRIQDMGKFATNREYRIPETILKHEDADHMLWMYEDAMQHIQFVYNELVAKGIPMEDARELMPLGAQHRMSWKLNISSLQHIFAKRGCQILQLGIWGPVIMSMIEELATKVHPIFSELVSPPCVKGDKYTGCVYQEEVRRRYTQDDKLPPCSLHYGQEMTTPGEGDSHDRYANHALSGLPGAPPQPEAMIERAKQYEAFWNRNPWTGKRLRVLP